MHALQVANGSKDIVRMLNDMAASLPGTPPVDLYPAAQAAEAEALCESIYTAINNGACARTWTCTPACMRGAGCGSVGVLPLCARIACSAVCLAPCRLVV